MSGLATLRILRDAGLDSDMLMDWLLPPELEVALLVDSETAPLLDVAFADPVTLIGSPPSSFSHESFLACPGGQSAHDVCVNRIPQNISSIIGPLVREILIQLSGGYVFWL